MNDTWTVRDNDNENEHTNLSRSEAKSKAQLARELGSEDVEIIPPESVTADGGRADVIDVEADPEVPDDLPERTVADDPLDWVPGHFIDEIDGRPAINRKGYEVLSHFYDISVSAELQVAPEDTGHEYARVKARAETPDGRTCESFGSAHVERGDDPDLLLEMADTRARKRALSIATGVGAVAVEELRNEVSPDE